MSTAGRIVILITLPLSGCAKEPDDWVRDLEDPDPLARRMAVVALRRTPPEDAVGIAAPLVRALGDRDADVRDAAARTLQDLAPDLWPALVRMLRTGEVRHGRPQVHRLLVGIGPPVVDPLIAALRDPELRDVELVALTAGKVGRPAVGPLLAALAGSGPEVRERLVRAIGHGGGAAAVAAPVLLRHATDGATPGIRRNAVEALGRVAPADPSVIEGLSRVLEHRGPDERELARTVIVRGLLLRLDHETTATAAADHLRRLGLDVVPALVAEVTGPRPRLHSWARRALETLGAPAVEPMLDHFDASSPAHQQALVAIIGRIGAAALPPLREALPSTPAHRRINALYAIGGLGAQALPALPDVIPLLRHEHGTTRLVAATLVGRLGPGARAAAPALEPLLRDRDRRVREAARVALQSLN